jgi:hypothetical protein
MQVVAEQTDTWQVDATCSIMSKAERGQNYNGEHWGEAAKSCRINAYYLLFFSVFSTLKPKSPKQAQ